MLVVCLKSYLMIYFPCSFPAVDIKIDTPYDNCLTHKALIDYVVKLEQSNHSLLVRTLQNV